jgi:hypothetical protein
MVTQSDNFWKDKFFPLSFQPYCVLMKLYQCDVESVLFSSCLTVSADMVYSDRTRICFLVPSTLSGNSRFVYLRPWQGVARSYVTLRSIHEAPRKRTCLYSVRNVRYVNKTRATWNRAHFWLAYRPAQCTSLSSFHHLRLYIPAMDTVVNQPPSSRSLCKGKVR